MFEKLDKESNTSLRTPDNTYKCDLRISRTPNVSSDSSGFILVLTLAKSILPYLKMLYTITINMATRKAETLTVLKNNLIPDAVKFLDSLNRSFKKVLL
jgi:hypothetical protein